MPEQELFTLHYITLHYITLHYIIYRYGFTLVFCNLHCIYIIYFRLVVYIATCTVYTHICISCARGMRCMADVQRSLAVVGGRPHTLVHILTPN